MNLAQEKQVHFGCEERGWMMLTEFPVNEKLREGGDRTMVMAWLSERRKDRHSISSNSYLQSRVHSMTLINCFTFNT